MQKNIHTLEISCSGIPFSRAYKYKCSSAVKWSNSASNCGQYPIFWWTDKGLCEMLKKEIKSYSKKNIAINDKFLSTSNVIFFPTETVFKNYQKLPKTY